MCAIFVTLFLYSLLNFAAKNYNMKKKVVSSIINVINFVSSHEGIMFCFDLLDLFQEILNSV